MSTLKPLVFILLTSFSGLIASGRVVNEQLHINRGTLESFDQRQFPALRYNASSSFEVSNRIIQLLPGDSLSLQIINNDTLSHEFLLDNGESNPIIIAAGDTGTFSLSDALKGIYSFSDPSNAVINRYLGLMGVLVVSGNSHNQFYWNLHEYQSSLNSQLEAPGSIDWSEFEPDYFMVNGRSSPYIDEDPSARVVANVSDTIEIIVFNSGRSVHPIHFHGFHVLVTNSSRNEQVGRKKDTVPIFPGEVCVLRMIPDKPGIYPVHDHNLVAVSGGGIYPNGMFMTMLIK